MTAHLIPAVGLLLLVLVTGRDARPGDRTPGQMWTSARTAPLWMPLWWLLCLVVGGLAVPLWYACRFGLYVVAFAVAAVLVRVASVAALDGRGLRLHRIEGGRA